MTSWGSFWEISRALCLLSFSILCPTNSRCLSLLALKTLLAQLGEPAELPWTFLPVRSSGKCLQAESQGDGRAPLAIVQCLKTFFFLVL